MYRFKQKWPVPGHLFGYFSNNFYEVHNVGFPGIRTCIIGLCFCEHWTKCS